MWDDGCRVSGLEIVLFGDSLKIGKSGMYGKQVAEDKLLIFPPFGTLPQDSVRTYA